MLPPRGAEPQTRRSNAQKIPGRRIGREEGISRMYGMRAGRGRMIRWLA